MREKMKGISFAVLLILLTGVFSPVSILAAETNAAERASGSITIESPVDKVSFRLYYIGTKNDQGGYNLVEPFDSYQVDMTGKDAAENLAGYVERDRDQIRSYREQSTVNGTLSFQELKLGAYLIIGEVEPASGISGRISPSLINLPYQDGTETLYDVEIQVKGSFDSPKECTVVKIWSADTGKARPKTITVQLLRNGAVYDEQILSDSNNWSYTWTKLDSYYSWRVLEKEVPDGYTVSYDTKVAGKVGITNTADSPSNKPPSNIPQTGQLWWPVAVLSAAGLGFILVGLMVRRRDN